ncbi:homeodomain-interacting protein kinase 2-like [Hippocampus zosterae]|uniref:homeodomain-interacting protein kinase 2-like n=1 Tax=Hippocampus zosterae TaxID=109293 RepID=UPI00223CE720|nr:homeodomain-interacting protein kinase 2-like [Hippocampus zosterae]
MSSCINSLTSDTSHDSVLLITCNVQTGQILNSGSSPYTVLEFVGKGRFGKVAKCLKKSTMDTVAVKIIKKDAFFIRDTEKELAMLKMVSDLNPDHANIIKFFERFEYMGHTCLVFEMLDCHLFDLLIGRNWEPMSLSEIRSVAKQLLMALDALKRLGILHTDIKPDNIMCVNKQDCPLRVKLIDFGLAQVVSSVHPGMKIQPKGYRAPEAALGLPFTEAVDVWSVGCVLVFLYIADNLFPVDCEYQMMKCMVDVLGQPQDHVLCAGKYTKRFFTKEEASEGLHYRLRTPEEYEAVNHTAPLEWSGFIEPPSSLDALMTFYPVRGEVGELEDRRAFVELLKWMLHLDGNQRISPHQALLQPFITMTHLSKDPDNQCSDYISTACSMMKNVQEDDCKDKYPENQCSDMDKLIETAQSTSLDFRSTIFQRIYRLCGRITPLFSCFNPSADDSM